jgi:hypothetical protein
LGVAGDGMTISSRSVRHPGPMKPHWQYPWSSLSTKTTFGASVAVGGAQGTVSYGAAQVAPVQATPPGQRSGLRGQHDWAASWAAE